MVALRCNTQDFTKQEKNNILDNKSKQKTQKQNRKYINEKKIKITQQ